MEPTLSPNDDDDDAHNDDDHDDDDDDNDNGDYHDDDDDNTITTAQQPVAKVPGGPLARGITLITRITLLTVILSVQTDITEQ